MTAIPRDYELLDVGPRTRIGPVVDRWRREQDIRLQTMNASRESCHVCGEPSSHFTIYEPYGDSAVAENALPLYFLCQEHANASIAREGTVEIPEGLQQAVKGAKQRRRGLMLSQSLERAVPEQGFGHSEVDNPLRDPERWTSEFLSDFYEVWVDAMWKDLAQTDYDAGARVASFSRLSNEVFKRFNPDESRTVAGVVALKSKSPRDYYRIWRRTMRGGDR